MKYRIIAPKSLKVKVSLPASKSICNRALIINALCPGGGGEIQNLSDCDDTQAMLRALSDLSQTTVDVGAAGTAMRFLTAFLSLQPGKRVLTGSERMRHRPVGVLVEALRSLGADIRYVGEEGFPPLEITGCELQGGNIELAGDVSSQYVSALMMIGPMLREGLHIRLKGRVVSRPYIKMTMEMMRQFGSDVRWQGQRDILIAPKRYTPTAYAVEPDWSAASYWYEILALTSDRNAVASLPGLRKDSLQGDAQVAKMFESLAVKTFFFDGTGALGYQGCQILRYGRAVKYLELDFKENPDVAQTFVVTCAMRGIPFYFSGLETLRIKETDRIAALCQEMAKVGVHIMIDSDNSSLIWPGPDRQVGGRECYLHPMPNCVIKTYDDHRMAMAFAPMALVMGSVIIDNPEVVSKSYPSYWEDLENSGFEVIEMD